MFIDFATLDNLRTHHDAWVRLLEEHRKSFSILDPDQEVDHRYISHEIEVLKVTLAQASELVEIVRGLGPLVLALQSDAV